LVGASEREGALGSIVYRNLAADSSLELFAVNPKHRSVHGKPAYARLAQLPKAPDLAVIAVPARSVPQVIADCGAAGIRAAVVLTSGFGEAGEVGRTLRE
jgi:acetyltransferase